MKIDEIYDDCHRRIQIPKQKRLTDLELYSVLRACLEVAEVCLRDEGELRALNERLQAKLVAHKEHRNRTYVERRTDVYLRACRFIFPVTISQSNTSRWATCLREAVRRQITSTTIVAHLAKNGGINDLFLGRERVERRIQQRTLRLDQQVQHTRLGTVSLKLLHQANNTYKIISMETS